VELNREALKTYIADGDGIPELMHIIADKVTSGEWLDTFGEADIFSASSMGIDRDDYYSTIVCKGSILKDALFAYEDIREVWNTSNVIIKRNEKEVERRRSENLKHNIKFGVELRGDHNTNEVKSMRKRQDTFAVDIDSFEDYGEANYRTPVTGQVMNSLYGQLKKLKLGGYTLEESAKLLKLDTDLAEKIMTNDSEIKQILELNNALLVSNIAEHLVKAALPGTTRELHFKYRESGIQGDNRRTEARLERVVIKEKPGDPQAMIKILEKIKPDYWKDKGNELISGDTGVLLLQSVPTTADQWEKAAKEQQLTLHRKMEDDR
jgi:hypothetical protein